MSEQDAIPQDVQGWRTIYGWVRETRELLFRYLEGLPDGVFTRERDDVPWRSMRNLHVHVADCYRYWIANFALDEGRPQLQFDDYPDVAAVRGAFRVMDEAVDRFLAAFGPRPDAPLTRPVRWRPEPFRATARWLFTHTVTHEFHHKGQIVMLGRELGYPVGADMDLVGPDVPSAG